MKLISSIILGSTGAINKLVNVLGLKDEKIRTKMVVFISTFEHHSNILPWKETGIEVKYSFRNFILIFLFFF
jgi:selenocysteine lyase/cysteine desulfurase